MIVLWESNNGISFLTDRQFYTISFHYHAEKLRPNWTAEKTHTVVVALFPMRSRHGTTSGEMALRK